MPGPVLDPAATAPFGLVTGIESGLASPNELSMALGWPRAGLRQRHRQAGRQTLGPPGPGSPLGFRTSRERMVGPVMRFCFARPRQWRWRWGLE